MVQWFSRRGFWIFSLSAFRDRGQGCFAPLLLPSFIAGLLPEEPWHWLQNEDKDIGRPADWNRGGENFSVTSADASSSSSAPRRSNTFPPLFVFTPGIWPGSTLTRSWRSGTRRGWGGRGVCRKLGLGATLISIVCQRAWETRHYRIMASLFFLNLVSNRDKLYSNFTWETFQDIVDAI